MDNLNWQPINPVDSFWVPRSLQTSRDVRQSAQQHVFFDDVAWKPISVQFKGT